MTKYKPLLALLSQLGLPYLDTLHKGENETYTSHKIVEEFLTLLGDSVRSNLVLKLQQSPCFGVICDETTDLSTSKQLIVYIKAIVNNVVETYFLALQELQEGTADSVTQCLKDILEEHGLEISKCAALGSDGSSVMIGVHNGVSAQLQHVQPSRINVLCVAAHWLALVVTQAAKVVGPVARFKNYINSLFVYFHRSPNRQGRLNATFEALFDKPALKLRKPAETRWLACDEVKKRLHPLSITLQHIASRYSSDVTALGLATHLSKYNFIAGVFFMSEILPILSHLSRIFQIENFNFGAIKPALERAKKSITTLKSLSLIGKADWQKELTEWEDQYVDGSSSGYNEASNICPTIHYSSSN